MMTISQLGGVTYVKKKVLFNKSDRQQQDHLNSILHKTVALHTQRVISSVRKNEIKLMAKLARDHAPSKKIASSHDTTKAQFDPPSHYRLMNTSSLSRRTLGASNSSRWSPSFKLDNKPLMGQTDPLLPDIKVKSVFDAASQRWIYRAPKYIAANAAATMAATSNVSR